MSSTPHFLPEAPHRVAFLALPGVQLLDIVGPMDAMCVANQVREGRRLSPAYSFETLGLSDRVRSESGLEIVATPLDKAGPMDTLVIGGYHRMASERLAPETLAAIKALRPSQRHVSVCAGAFVLGALGRLDGRRCTTHWLAIEALRAQYPKADVESDAIYVDAHPVYTSAGVTSGIDLTLHLIEQDLGAAMALLVARLMVVFLNRPGGQSQFGVIAQGRRGVEVRLRTLMTQIAEHPEADHRVPALAKRAGMSPRNFARVFREQTGETPGAYVRRVRVEAARRALELTDWTADHIAETVGLGSDESLRRAFHSHLGVSPADYRQRFKKRT